MKTFFKRVLLLLILIPTIYLIFSISNSSFDPSTWPNTAKNIFGGLGLLAILWTLYSDSNEINDVFKEK